MAQLNKKGSQITTWVIGGRLTMSFKADKAYNRSLYEPKEVKSIIKGTSIKVATEKTHTKIFLNNIIIL